MTLYLKVSKISESCFSAAVLFHPRDPWEAIVMMVEILIWLIALESSLQPLQNKLKNLSPVVERRRKNKTKLKPTKKTKSKCNIHQKSPVRELKIPSPSLICLKEYVILNAVLSPTYFWLSHLQTKMLPSPMWTS